MNVVVKADPAAVGGAAASHIAAALRQLPGHTTLGLAGGSTPRPTYLELAKLDVPWEDVTMWLGDERWVAHHHPESNVGMVRGELVDKVHGQLLAPNHAIGDPHTAAAAYERALASSLIDRGEGKAPDVVMLGIGDDGHTASLFPGTEALEVTRCGYVANWVEPLEAWRLTATLPLLASALELVFIVTGAGKSSVLREIIVEAHPYPAQQVAAAAGRVTWFVDEAAASEL